MVPLATKHTFKLAKTLGGSHHDTINFLSFSPCGRFLASGGDDDCLCIYNCSDPANFEISFRIKVNSPPSAICWDAKSPMTVFVGYGNGGLVKHSADHNGEEWLPGVLLQNNSDRVVSLAWDGILAVATRATVYLVGRDPGNILNWDAVPKPPNNATSRSEPRAVAFTSNGYLLIAYLEHGIYCWSRDGKTQKWSFQPRNFRIGRFSYNPTRNVFMIHNLYDGFDAYKIKGSTIKHFRSYPWTAPKECNVPLSCISIGGGKSVVHGTTAGKVVILDTEKVFVKQTLQHCEDDGLIQEIAICSPSSRGYTLIATTASERGANTDIKLWMSPAETDSEGIDYAGEVLEKITAAVNVLFRGYYFLGRMTIEVPLIWLITGAALIVTFSFFLSIPTGWNYSGIFGPWIRPLGNLPLSAKQGLSSLLRAALGSLLTPLSHVTLWIHQFIGEELKTTSSVDVIQTATLIGTVTTVATTVVNQRPIATVTTTVVNTRPIATVTTTVVNTHAITPVVPIATGQDAVPLIIHPQAEPQIQLESTFQITRDEVYTEVQEVINYYHVHAEIQPTGAIDYGVMDPLNYDEEQ